MNKNLVSIKQIITKDYEINLLQDATGRFHLLWTSPFSQKVNHRIFIDYKLADFMFETHVNNYGGH